MPALRSCAPVARCFAAAILLVVCVNGCKPAPGRLAFEPAQVDVSAGDLLSQEQQVTVMLRNVGGGSLDIAELKPSCACTVTQALETTHLEKGAGVAIKLGVSPPVYGSTDVIVVAQATSRDVPPAVLSLRLHGSSQVPHLFTATRSVDLAGTAPREELIGVVDISTDESATAPAWVIGLGSSSAEVTTELVERKADLKISEDVVRCAYVFAVHGVTPERGTVVSDLSVQTSAPPAGKNTVLPHIRVTRQYAPVLRALPGELIARRRGDNPRAECRLAVVADDEVPFELSFDRQADWFSVSTGSESRGSATHRHTLLVEIDTDKYPHLADGEVPALVLTTTHPKCQQLTVPVRILVE